MDEPSSALDPVATLRIEELMAELGRATPSSSSPTTCSRRRGSRRDRVPDDGRRPRRLARRDGRHGEIFTNPKDKLTEDYITGRFG